MSEENGKEKDGVFRIERKGKMKVALGDGEPFEFDVIAAQNQWIAIDASLRGEDNEIADWDNTGRQKYYEAVVQFVTDMSKTEKCPDGTPNITLAEGMEFLKVITVEGKRLKDFFRIPSDDEPSSPENSPTVRYSA